MKLLFSILDDRSAGRVADALVAKRYGVTRINTVGGFLKRGNATLLVGVEDGQVDDAIAIMRSAYEHGASRTSDGTGPVFVVGVQHSERM